MIADGHALTSLHFGQMRPCRLFPVAFYTSAAAACAADTSIILALSPRGSAYGYYVTGDDELIRAASFRHCLLPPDERHRHADAAGN